MSQSIVLDETADLPGALAVEVVLERSPSSSRWAQYHWNVIGVIAGREEDEPGMRLVSETGDIQQYLYTGLKIQLHQDECESYYHNLRSPQPSCFVVAWSNEQDSEGAPQPFVVSLSFDEAHAYQEGDHLVFAVPLPPELYIWSEAYVISFYAPEKHLKRKRDNWKDAPRRGEA